MPRSARTGRRVVILIYPGAVWQPLPGSHGGPTRNHRGLVSHITTDEGNPWGYFSNPANEASSHFIILRDGTVIQCLDLLVASWAQAGGNYDWVSVEVVGAEFTPKSPQQMEAFAQLLAWGHNQPQLQWPLQATDDPNGRGLGWHGMGGVAWGNHPHCPGDVRMAQRPQLLARAIAIAASTPPPGVLMALSDADQTELLGRVRDLANLANYAFVPEPAEGSFPGSQGKGELTQRIRAIHGLVAAQHDIDAASIAAAIPADLAQQVVTELGKRIAAQP